MSEGRYLKKKEKKVSGWLIAVLVVILVLLIALAIVVIMHFGGDSELNPFVSAGDSTTQTDDHHQVNEDSDKDDRPDASNVSGENGDVEGTDRLDSSDETGKNTGETQAEQGDDPQPTAVIVQKADAEYEKWLSAAMFVCVSMEYPDFRLEGIYTASATELEDKFTSDGAYIIFESGGSRMAIHSVALEGERTASGTVDISTEAIGYATFDQVDPAVIDVATMEQIDPEDLDELISQSLLASIYMR